MISEDLRFAFDVQGYLHLKGLIPASELETYAGWMAAADKTDVAALQSDVDQTAVSKRAGYDLDYLNRPVSRPIDADPRFARFLDHPAVAPYLSEFLGRDYKHIDNDLYYTSPGYKGGSWHRGCSHHPSGHVVDGKFLCPMVKAFYCMTDVGPGQGEFVVIPGTHRSQLEVEMDGRVDLPAQKVFDDVKAGDVILFNEGILHNGRPNTTQKTRKTIIMNFGRAEAGVWPGYKPKPETLAKVTENQKRILTNKAEFWEDKEFKI
jgi:ectoine hydroxylase-related dioxygenase (phytanoyl-CoA dioxygenase family)